MGLKKIENTSEYSWYYNAGIPFGRKLITYVSNVKIDKAIPGKLHDIIESLFSIKDIPCRKMVTEKGATCGNLEVNTQMLSISKIEITPTFFTLW